VGRCSRRSVAVDLDDLEEAASMLRAALRIDDNHGDVLAVAVNPPATI
jgi:hypothetical protein